MQISIHILQKRSPASVGVRKPLFHKA